MPRSTPTTHHPHKWAVSSPREMQMAIRQRLEVECELQQEPPMELSTRLTRKDKEHDPYADVVGTC
jgi:hypothetical protein